jgi:hypothetical protein
VSGSIYNRYPAAIIHRPKDDKGDAKKRLATGVYFLTLGDWLRMADDNIASRRVAPTMRMINALKAVPSGLTSSELFLAVYGVAPERRPERKNRLDTDALRVLIANYNGPRRPAYAPPGKIERHRIEGKRESRYTFVGEAQP